jgi:hypothetical protein
LQQESINKELLDSSRTKAKNILKVGEQNQRIPWLDSRRIDAKNIP